MKTKYILSLLLALLMAGCNDNFNPTTEKGREAGQKAITFMLPAPSGGATRASSLAADEHEKVIQALMVYMFDADKRLEETFQFTKADLAPTANNLPVTLHLDEFKNGLKHFYFVANCLEATPNQLGNLHLDVYNTTEAAFLTAMQSLSAGYIKYDGYDLTLPMYGVDSKDNEYLTVPDVANPATTPYSVSLKRAVARFDIANDSATTNFKVTGIAIAGAKNNGLVYPAARPDAAATGMTSVINIDAAALTHAANHSTTATSTPEFYLMPTELNDTTTRIWIHGSYIDPMSKETSDRVIAVQHPVSTPAKDTDDDIVKNKLYMIVIDAMNPDSITALLKVADWDEANNLNGHNSTEMSILSVKEKAVQGQTSNGTVTKTNDSTYTYTNLAPSTTQATRLTVRMSMLNSTLIPVPIFTSGLSYSMDTSVDEPHYVPNPEPHFEMDIDIVMPFDTYNPIEQDTILIKDKKGKVMMRIVIKQFATPDGNIGGATVMIGGIWWAPVNVGATKIPPTGQMATTPMTTAIGGYVYQWGRPNAPFETNNPPTTAAGPVTVAVANANPTVFYTNNSGDWCTTHDVTMWGGKGNAQGPCPDGWRMPTKDEFEKITQIAEQDNGNSASSPKWYTVTGDDNKSKLYFVGRGFLRYDGVPTNVGSSSDTWTTTLDPANSQNAYAYFFAQGAVKSESLVRAYAMPVRCVRTPK